MVIFQPDQIGFATLGGIILGIATSLNYILRGKVTGMSGIVYGIISLNKNQIPEKLTIVGGMFLISAVFYLIFGQDNYSGFQPFGPQQQIAQWTTYPGFALAGLLVGFGTKFSNGCTSGHGLCGMARLSIRSFVAVGTFLCTAIVIGTISYQAKGLGPFDNDPNLNPQQNLHYNHTISSLCFIAIGLILPILGFIIKKKATPRDKFDTTFQIKDQFIVFMVGLLFSVGLMVSGMTRRINILQFLWIGDQWNPALMFVLGSGLFVNIITFQYMIRHRGKPVIGDTLFNPQVRVIDFKLVFGAFMFGLGWGIGGLCPGPFLVLFSTFTIGVNLIWGVSLFIGMIIAAKISQIIDEKEKAKKQQLDDTKTALVSDKIQVPSISAK